MNAQTNTDPTREGGKERTAAARSTSRDFRPGDRVALTIDDKQVEGTIAGEVVDSTVDTYVVYAKGSRLFRKASELTPLADSPEFVEEALVIDNEAIDLGDVDEQDGLTAASLEMANALVRICRAGELKLCERITLNGVTWLVEVRPE